MLDAWSLTIWSNCAHCFYCANCAQWAHWATVDGVDGVAGQAGLACRDAVADPCGSCEWCACENFDAHQPHTEVFVVCLDGQCGRRKCVNLEEDFFLPLSIVSLWSGQLTKHWINSCLWAWYLCPKGWEEPTLYFCICIFFIWPYHRSGRDQIVKQNWEMASQSNLYGPLEIVYGSNFKYFPTLFTRWGTRGVFGQYLVHCS